MSEPRELPAPPAGESIHMPASSVLPLINAAALAIAIVSVTMSWVLVAAAMVVWVATTIKWIGDTRRDIEHLPAEHR